MNRTKLYRSIMEMEGIMLEDRALERDELAPHESPDTVPAFAHEEDQQSRMQEISRKPVVKEAPVAEAPPPVESDEGQLQSAKQSRSSFLRRRPVISAIGAVLLASVLGGGYL